MEDNLKKILPYAPITVAFNITCHTLRHSMASHLNDKDVDILVIQSDLKENSISPACACPHADRSVTSTNIYLLINRFYNG